MSDNPQPQQSVRSPYHRVIYTNSIGMRAGDNDFQIVFSIEHGAGENVFLEEAVVAMSPRSAKLLWAMLGGAIESIETQTGPIDLPIDPTKLRTVEIKRPG